MPAPKGNKFAVGNKGGRPPKYESPDHLEKACELFFSTCKEDKEPPTVSGLALFLGFMDRQSLYDYQEKEEYTCIIKKAKLRIESEYEKALRMDKSAAGSIFALKNMGWRDKQDIEHSGEIKGDEPQINLIVDGRKFNLKE